MSIVDAGGNVKATYKYDPYGNLVSSEPAANSIGAINPIRYRGYYYDTDSQLYYLQSRYYDPELGRFLNADAFASTGQGLLGINMFTYCLNCPTTYCDWEGSDCVLTIPLYKGLDGHNGGSGAGAGGGSGILIIYAVELVEDTAKKIRIWVETAIGEKEYSNQSVYVLKDPNNGYLVKYVGRTNDPKRREYEHQHDDMHPWRENYIMVVLLTGLTKEQAIICEQALISAYTITYLENARREIAKRNVRKFADYMEATAEILTGIPADDINTLISRR